jgi:hypothetical protein
MVIMSERDFFFSGGLFVVLAAPRLPEPLRDARRLANTESKAVASRDDWSRDVVVEMVAHVVAASLLLPVEWRPPHDGVVPVLRHG